MSSKIRRKFINEDITMSDDILIRLMDVLEARKQADADTSYVASLYHKGLDSILKKIGEESAETIIAGKADDDEQVIYEMADLWFHSLVLLAHKGLSVEQVLQELERRFGLSGHEEKASRKQS